jgi:xanthine dehydrogenase accessory factor
VNPWSRLADLVAADGIAALVTVRSVEGSTPREAGTRLVVRADGAFHGTIGGGRLEWEALVAARAALAAGRGPARQERIALGPDLGQCCGGRAGLLVETFDARDLPDLARLAPVPGDLACRIGPDGRVERRAGPVEPAGWHEPTEPAPTPVLLFGAGHVGRAVVMALAPLPFAVRWIDGRPDAFPARVPANAVAVRAPAPEAEIAGAPGGALVLVMTHAHPIDLAVTAAALARPDLFVGLIGSATKRARFARRFRALGIPETRIGELACPVGMPALADKAPAVIAAGIAVQVLLEREARRRGRAEIGRAA